MFPIWKWSIGVAMVALQMGGSPNPVYRPGKSTYLPTKGAELSTPKKPNAHPVDVVTISTAGAYQLGVASFYGKAFHGRKTANGETFNMYKLTAAHRVWPLGTMGKVTNLSNGRWVEVKVNDRGPFIEGRVLDLSFAAALELEMVKAGTAKVMIELIDD